MGSGPRVDDMALNHEDDRGAPQPVQVAFAAGARSGAGGIGSHGRMSKAVISSMSWRIECHTEQYV
jgi:hypothetical protein